MGDCFYSSGQHALAKVKFI